MSMPALKTVEQPVFLKKKHELADLLKKLEDVSDEAVDVVVGTMRSSDSSPKMKSECATMLLTLQIKVSDTISKDQLTRQIAEVKSKGLSTPLTLEPGEKRKLPPKLDMKTIQSV